MTSVMNVYECLSMIETEIVDDAKDAEIIVTDKLVDIVKCIEVIGSFDTEKILALRN